MNHDIEPESIDLIYLDPPFFTGKVQKGNVANKLMGNWQPGAMEVSYEDSKKFWASKATTMRDNAPEWLKYIALQRPDFASYLYYMMERLRACHRVLKSTGSIYLHCDEKASHYLKMIMDDIFGYINYKNEIIWHYGLGAFRSKDKYPSKHDAILFYVKNHKDYNFNKLRGKVTKAMSNKYCHNDKDGDYMISYGKKYYLKGGKPIDDVWDIPNLSATDKKERVGYPTQKPLELLKRIITASSNIGQIVLDPFCGCGSCIIASSELDRNWIGVDISKFAYDITISRKNNAQPMLINALSDSKYITRDLDEIKTLNPIEFEVWVNEYYKATKPMPDKGVDGITQDGIPIQTKAYLVKYPLVSEFATNVRYHHSVPQPTKKAIMVSQVGFDEGSRKRQFEIKTTDGIDIEFKTPKELLNLEA
jgi:site-specific DNA-methyltransferase (adenine-specific)